MSLSLSFLLMVVGTLLLCSCATPVARPVSAEEASTPGREQGYHLPENHWASQLFRGFVGGTVSL